MGYQLRKGNSKVECPLRKDEETLQGPCVTVTQETLDSSTDRRNEKEI